MREFYANLFASPEYAESVTKRILKGEASHMETLGHHYALGKPADTTVIEGAEGRPLAVTIVHKAVK